MSGATRCLVADDHPAMTTAVCQYLAANGFDVVGPAADGRAAVALAAAEGPELALVDYRMPWLEGRAMVAALRDASPATRICVYTGDADEQLVEEAIDAGAIAVVLKESPLRDVVRALELTLAGKSYIDPAIDARRGVTGTLTPRELAVLELLAEGLAHEEIGKRLGIGSETVRTHVKKASDRLGATTRTQAVAKALRLGLIT